MQSSPPYSDAKARAIRELSASLNHSQRSVSSVHSAPSDSNPTKRTGFGDTTDDFFNNPDVLMSTQHNFDDETNTLPRYPRIRSTAKKATAWRMPQSEVNPDTSMVNKEFGDFDHSISDEEVEQARGDRRSNRGTPSKMSSHNNFDSLYDVTPPTGRSRKSQVAETGSLRRDAQLRRASRNDIENTASPRPLSTRNSPAMTARNEPKRASLAQLHAKISEDESSFMDERPATVTFQHNASTRWGNPRSRQTSLQMDANVEASPRVSATPRSQHAGANVTAQSFILPDLPNLTELVSGVFENGTPVFSKTTPARSRFAQPGKGSNGGRQPTHVPIDSVPIPQDEKAIFAGLQLLQSKLAQLEHERAEQDKKIEEQELEIIELKASKQAQEKFRYSDSALGSTDGEGSGKGSWKVEKTRLDATVQTLRTKLDRVERKIAVTDIEKKRLSAERDNMAGQLGVAFQTCEELKAEKQALTAENDALRDQVDALRAENEHLRDDLDHEQAQFREETADLRRQLDQTENVTQRQNITLQAELNRARQQHDENTQQLARKDAELARARQEQAEFEKLRADHEHLQSQLTKIRAKREEDLQRWSNQEASLKKMVDRRDETIRTFQDNTQEQTNEAIRMDNEQLREELAQLNVQHEEEYQRWTEKEEELNRKIAKRSRDHVQEASRTSRGNASYQATQPKVVSRKPSIKAMKPSRQASGRGDTSRSVSAPISRSRHAEVLDEVESTTDISLAPLATPHTTRGHRTGRLATGAIQPPADLEYTELSEIDTNAIAQLRRQLEEERAALRSERAAREDTIRSEKIRDNTIRSERVVREDTVRSTTSQKSARRPSLPRKSSMKETTRTNMTQFEEDNTGNISNIDNTDMSMLSNTSRRRRSAPTEMTSAFIVPDLKIEGRRQSTIKLDLTQTLKNKQHDNENCTVCRREAANESTDSLRVPKLIPVSKRMPDDVDATLRPARSPKEALALVVKELRDERFHLHAELAVVRAMLEAHDVSLGRKKRVQYEAAISELLAKIKIKDDQIYNLYDVLEGQQEEDITEQFVEEATEQIRAQDAEVEKKNREKKVTIQSFHEDDGEDEELPWEGFESTAEHNFTSNSVRLGIY